MEEEEDGEEEKSPQLTKIKGKFKPRASESETPRSPRTQTDDRGASGSEIHRVETIFINWLSP